MNMVKRMSKKKLLETYKKNYEMMAKSKKEYYEKNIELQKAVIEKDKLIDQLKKDKKVLKSKLTKALKQIDKYQSIEVAQSIEEGNKIIEEIFRGK